MSTETVPVAALMRANAFLEVLEAIISNEVGQLEYDNDGDRHRPLEGGCSGAEK